VLRRHPASYMATRSGGVRGTLKLEEAPGTGPQGTDLADFLARNGMPFETPTRSWWRGEALHGCRKVAKD
jgi:hypothetical protein